MHTVWDGAPLFAYKGDIRPRQDFVTHYLTSHTHVALEGLMFRRLVISARYPTRLDGDALRGRERRFVALHALPGSRCRASKEFEQLLQEPGSAYNACRILMLEPL